MKRFYRVAGTAEVDCGCTVVLDDRPIKTPGKSDLVLRNQRTAQAIADEWATQGERIESHTMPLMALACTAIDIVGPQRAETVAEIAAFGETDLVCYRAEEPEALVRLQAAVWQPLIDWAAREHDAALSVARGILPRPQPTAAVAALAHAVERHDDMELAALATAVRVSGSLIIGLALSGGRLDAESAFEAAELDTSYQIETWGEDAEASRFRAAVKAELDAARRFLTLHRG